MKENTKQISSYEIIWNKHDRNPKALAGKVIDRCAIYNKGSQDDQLFIITFTDGTFLCLGIDYDDDRRDNCLRDNWVTYDFEDINDIMAKYHAYKDSNGKIKLDSYGELLREFGFITITDEQAAEIKEKIEKRIEDEEYKQYLRLKEKFEKKIK